MSNYVISCCSTADLTKEHFEKRNISYICFHYELNGKEYADDLGQSMPFDVFYKAMQDGASTKTSQVNADEFEEYFEGFLKQGKDVLHVCLSSGISGVINSANVAKAELEEKYPDRKILVVDSLGASSGYGLFMDKLASVFVPAGAGKKDCPDLKLSDPPLRPGKDNGYVQTLQPVPDDSWLLLPADRYLTKHRTYVHVLP